MITLHMQLIYICPSTSTAKRECTETGQEVGGSGGWPQRAIGMLEQSPGWVYKVTCRCACVGVGTWRRGGALEFSEFLEWWAGFGLLGIRIGVMNM
jgi:hypothetical protein